MAKIRTKEALKDYVLRHLGSPHITIDVTDDQLEDAIDATVQEFSNTAMDGEEQTIVIVTNPSNTSLHDIVLDDRTQEVLAVRGPNNYSTYYNIPPNLVLTDASFNVVIPSVYGQTDIGTMISSMAYMSTIEALFRIELNYEYNYNTKILRLFEPVDTDILVHVSLEYEPQQQDLIYDHTWIKRMAIEQVRYIWSNVTGKFDQTLVNGSRINYDTMRSTAEQNMDKLREELYNKWMPPAPLLVG